VDRLREGLHRVKKTQAKTARETPPPPAPLFGEGPSPQPKQEAKLRPPTKKQNALAAVAASSSGRNLAAAGLAAGETDRKGLAAGAGSAPARNEEPGRGASLGCGEAIEASVPAAAAPAGVGSASARDEGPRGGAAWRGEDKIQDRSSSSSGKIARRGRPAVAASKRSLRQPQKTTRKPHKKGRAPSPSHAAVAGETRQKEEHERAKGE
jgi:hypothetical protein